MPGLVRIPRKRGLHMSEAVHGCSQTCAGDDDDKHDYDGDDDADDDGDDDVVVHDDHHHHDAPDADAHAGAYVADVDAPDADAGAGAAEADGYSDCDVGGDDDDDNGNVCPYDCVRGRWFGTYRFARNSM